MDCFNFFVALNRVSQSWIALWYFVESKSGKFLFCWGEQGNSEGKLNGPSGITFDIEGNLLVVDHLNKYEVDLLSRKVKVNLDKDFIQQIGELNQLKLKIKS